MVLGVVELVRARADGLGGGEVGVVEDDEHVADGGGGAELVALEAVEHALPELWIEDEAGDVVDTGEIVDEEALALPSHLVRGRGADLLREIRDRAIDPAVLVRRLA